MIAVCVVGTVAVVADNITAVGIADDFLLGPLGTGIERDISMLFNFFK